eukprot:4995116-Pyramimonas_sp.AAC.1
MRKRPSRKPSNGSTEAMLGLFVFLTEVMRLSAVTHQEHALGEVEEAVQEAVQREHGGHARRAAAGERRPEVPRVRAAGGRAPRAPPTVPAQHGRAPAVHAGGGYTCVTQ